MQVLTAAATVSLALNLQSFCDGVVCTRLVVGTICIPAGITMCASTSQHRWLSRLDRVVKRVIVDQYEQPCGMQRHIGKGLSADSVEERRPHGVFVGF